MLWGIGPISPYRAPAGSSESLELCQTGDMSVCVCPREPVANQLPSPLTGCHSFLRKVVPVVQTSFGQFIQAKLMKPELLHSMVLGIKLSTDLGHREPWPVVGWTPGRVKWQSIGTCSMYADVRYVLEFQQVDNSDGICNWRKGFGTESLHQLVLAWQEKRFLIRSSTVKWAQVEWMYFTVWKTWKTIIWALDFYRRMRLCSSYLQYAKPHCLQHGNGMIWIWGRNCKGSNQHTLYWHLRGTRVTRIWSEMISQLLRFQTSFWTILNLYACWESLHFLEVLGASLRSVHRLLLDLCTAHQTSARQTRLLAWTPCSFFIES